MHPGHTQSLQHHRPHFGKASPLNSDEIKAALKTLGVAKWNELSHVAWVAADPEVQAAAAADDLVILHTIWRNTAESLLNKLQATPVDLDDPKWAKQTARF